MIDTDKYEGQIEFDYVLKEIEVGVDISEGNYDILRYYRDEYKDLLAEVKRLREQIVDMIGSMDNYYIRDIQHATDCLRDMIGYYEDEEE